MSNAVNSFIRLASQMPHRHAFDLCKLASDHVKTRIDVMAVPKLPKRAPSLLVRRRDDTFLILYCSCASSLMAQISILHELAHILLGHRQTTLRHSSEKNFYTDAEEREGERLAHRLMALIVRELSSETNSLSTRFASLMPRHPTAVSTIHLSAETRPARRFRALMGD